MSVARTLHPAFSVQWSPYAHDQVAVATAQHFGIVGNGAVVVLRCDDGPDGRPVDGRWREQRVFETAAGVADVAWSEVNPFQLATGQMDGTVKLWDLNTLDGFPIASFNAHSEDVQGVDWDLHRNNAVLSVSSDKAVRLWDPSRPGPAPVSSWEEHSHTVYEAHWAPRVPGRFMTCSRDCSVRVFDTSTPKSGLVLAAHPQDVVCCDWNKYSEHIIVTGSLDRTLRVWDLRRTGSPLTSLSGHKLGVRRCQWSPHSETSLASASYDMSVCVWNTAAPSPLVQLANHHSEFVFGLGWRLWKKQQLTTCSWDLSVCTWDVTGPPPGRIPATRRRSAPAPPRPPS